MQELKDESVLRYYAEKDGKVWAIKDKSQGDLIIGRIHTNEEPKITMAKGTSNSNDVECPHCHKEVGDSWELAIYTATIFICTNCDNAFTCRRVVDVYYRAEPLNLQMEQETPR